jgi:transmembrane E3 ubiquitin-protein ligase
VTLVCLVQIGLLFRQLYHSNTQAAAARVSLVCIGMQAVLDAVICVLHLLLCAYFQPLFVALASVAFFKLVNFCIFEMRFLILVYQSRQPQSFFEGGWQAMRNELAVLHGRFYLALFATLAASWSLYRWMPALLLVMYSFWVPQIVSNVLRDTRHSLHPLYLVGMSATRLFLPLYLYACPSNFITVILGPSHFKMHYQVRERGAVAAHAPDVLT